MSHLPHSWLKNRCFSWLKDDATHQCCMLPPKPLSHFIILWGDAIRHLALKHSYHCGSAKNVIKNWVINLVLAAQSQNKTALIFSLLLNTQEQESAPVCRWFGSALWLPKSHAGTCARRTPLAPMSVSPSLSSGGKVRNEQKPSCHLNRGIPGRCRGKSQRS